MTRCAIKAGQYRRTAAPKGGEELSGSYRCVVNSAVIAFSRVYTVFEVSGHPSDIFTLGQRPDYKKQTTKI